MSRKLLASAAFFVSTTATAGPLVNSARVTGNLVAVAGQGKSMTSYCAVSDGDERVEVPMEEAEFTEDGRCSVSERSLRRIRKARS